MHILLLLLLYVLLLLIIITSSSAITEIEHRRVGESWPKVENWNGETNILRAL